MTALVQCLAMLLMEPGAVSVAFDPGPLSDSEYRRLDGLALERKIALRLVQEGFAVVAAGSPSAGVVVRLLPSASGLALEAVVPQRRLRRTVRLEGASNPELHLEISQKVSELTRALAAEVRAETPPAPTPAPTQPPVPVEAPEPVRSRPASLGVTIGGAASWRGTAGADPLVLLAARLGLRAVGIDLEVGGAGSSGAASLTVLDFRACAGLGYRFQLGEHFDLEPAVAAGVLVHAWSTPDAFASSPQGALATPAGWARLRTRWLVTSHFAVEVRLALGVTRPVTHVEQGETQWSQGPLRGEAGVGLSWMP